MGTDNNTAACERRIDQKLKDRLAEFFPDVTGWSLLKCARRLKEEGRALATPDVECAREEVLETIRQRAHEDLLSVDKTVTYRLCLSWGGPADYFELDWSPHNGEWRGGRYLFQDWFDGASRALTLEQVEQIAELFGIHPAEEADASR
jgi:hypothetical protein